MKDATITIDTGTYSECVDVDGGKPFISVDFWGHNRDPITDFWR